MVEKLAVGYRGGEMGETPQREGVHREGRGNHEGERERREWAIVCITQ